MSITRISLVKNELAHTDMFVDISFTQDFDFLGAEDDLRTYRAQETAKAIPQTVDMEWIRFSCTPQEQLVLKPNFLNVSLAQVNRYEATGFTPLQLLKHSQAISRSLYVVEVYDSADPDKRVKLSDNILKANEKDAWVKDKDGIIEPSIRINGTCEGTRLYIPAYILAKTDSPITVYLRISFFNAVKGKRVYFSQGKNSRVPAPKYIQVSLNPIDRTYQLIGQNGNLSLYEEPKADNNQIKVLDALTRFKALNIENNRGSYEPLREDINFPPAI